MKDMLKELAPIFKRVHFKYSEGDPIVTKIGKRKGIIISFMLKDGETEPEYLVEMTSKINAKLREDQIKFNIVEYMKKNKNG